MMRELLGRALGTALLLLAIAFALAGGGATGAMWLLTVLAIGSQRELVRIVRRLSPQVVVMRGQVYLWTLAIPLGAWYLPAANWGIWLTLAAVLLMVVDAIFHLTPRQLLTGLLPSLLCVLYIPFTLQFAAILIRDGATPLAGLWRLAWVVGVCKCADIGGLLVGIAGGRHSLSREYSPTKTWEGFFGGMAFAVIGGTALWVAGRHFGNFSLPLRPMFLCAILLAAVAAVSDLLESALKRLAKVKNSGNVLPGIGGCLDCCDSLILALPAAHLLLQLVGS